MIVFANAYLGRIDGCIAAASSLLDRPEIGRGAWLRTSVFHWYARVLRDRFAGLEGPLERISNVASELRDVFPLLEDIVAATAIGGDIFSGNFDRAVPAIRSRLAEAMRAGMPEPIGYWSFTLGWTLSAIGDMNGAVAAHEEALACLLDRDSVGLTPLSLLDLTYVHGVRGEEEQAQARFAQYREIIGGGNLYPFGETRYRRAEAWIKYLEGDLEGASASSRASGEISIDNGELVLGMEAFHDSVRWGRPDPVVDGLDYIANEVEGRLAAAFADHARSLSESDPESLERVSTAFESMGAWLYAAESGMQAASIYESHNHAGRARRARARASLLAARCPGARTPPLRDKTMSVLTARESEVADLAVRGLTSAEIADLLVISIRTVDNHLGSVYRKLGVNGRTELPDLLAGSVPID